MANKVGWANKKVDDDLLPIIKRIQEKMVVFRSLLEYKIFQYFMYVFLKGTKNDREFFHV